MSTLVCDKCGNEFPATGEYFYRREGKLFSRCKTCYNTRHPARCIPKFRALNPVKRCGMCGKDFPRTEEYFSHKKHTQDGLDFYCKKCKEERRLMRTYGISVEDYNSILECQEFKCAICGRSTEELKRSLNVDHDHRTNRVRGLLCYDCNRALGLFGERKSVLMKAVKYLDKKVE